MEGGMDKSVLIISNPEDEHTARVAAHIRQIGGVPILFYPEELGHSIVFRSHHDGAGFPAHQMLVIDGEPLDLSQVSSIWYRRPRLQPADEEAMSYEGVMFARDEWKAALEGAYALLDDKLWVSHPDHLYLAARKPYQLRLAAELGLRTPRTLITNDPDQVRTFFRSCDGQVVVKATGSGWVYAQDGDDVYYVLTNRLTLDELDADDAIKTSPLTLQEEIAKVYEVRANVVGQQVLAIRIDSQASPESALDWRRYDLPHTPYAPYVLPDNIARKCLQLTQRLGLEFGAIDLIRTPMGEYVFLEINGNGQFLWAEEHSGVGISAALANLLVGNAPALRSAVFTMEVLYETVE